MLVHGLRDVPGVAGAAFCLEGRILASTIEIDRLRQDCRRFSPADSAEGCRQACSSDAADGLTRLWLQTNRRNYGSLILLVQDPPAFAGFRTLLQNTANLAALRIENERGLAALAEVNRNIESLVSRRALQWQQGTEQLRRAQKLDAVGRLAAGIARDFEGLLTVIQTNTALLEPLAAGSAEAANLVKEIADAGDQAAAQTRQLLLLSRRQPLRPKPVQLGQLVGDLAPLLNRLLGDNISLEFTADPALPRVNVEAGLLEQVIINLAVNARDAMPEGGKLRLRASCETLAPEQAAAHPEIKAGPYVCLSVSDTGTGIAPEIRSRVFEPFLTAKGPETSADTGLAAAYGIIRQHGGWIGIESAEGQGATFRISLPALSAARTDHPGENVPPLEQGRGQTILVVEDEKAVRRLVCRILTSYGYHVLEAASGADALQLPEEQLSGVSLVFTDIVMPGGLNGWELAELLRLRLPAIKVIFTSGYSSEISGLSTRLDAENQFAQRPCFLQKPYDVGNLLEAVHACIAPPQPPAGP